jgi:hypothetical protein
MTFGLKNAGATYQQCVQECLASQISRSIHIYINDVVIKSNQHDELLADLAETFTNLQRYKIKLNSQKCIFSMPTANYLAASSPCTALRQSIKINTIVWPGKPECLRDVQKLRGRVAAPSPIIPRLGEKASPLYRQLCGIITVRGDPDMVVQHEGDDTKLANVVITEERNDDPQVYGAYRSTFDK